jgi:hypothetical protein
MPKSRSVSAAVASSTTRRPSSVIAASTPRPSAGLGRRVTYPAATRRSIALVTLVGCTINRLPITLSGSSPRRLKVSSTSTS